MNLTGKSATTFLFFYVIEIITVPIMKITQKGDIIMTQKKVEVITKDPVVKTLAEDWALWLTKLGKINVDLIYEFQGLGMRMAALSEAQMQEYQNYTIADHLQLSSEAYKKLEE